MPQFWIAIFFILLAGAELYQSVKEIALPFPVYLVLGTVLAVAANSRYQFSSSNSERVTLQDLTTPTPTPTVATNPAIDSTATARPQISAAEPIDVVKLPELGAAQAPTPEPIQPKPAQKKPSRPRKSSPKPPKQQ
jgi:hypothetical protein